MEPIWKDYFAYLSGGPGEVPAFRYRICADGPGGEVIYQGYAIGSRPNAILRVKMNDVCANYILHSDINFNATINGTRVSRIFVFQYWDGSSWTTYFSVEFQADWSYDYIYNPSRDGLQFPISGFAGSRQRILRTVLSGSSITAALTFRNGSTYNVSVPVVRSTDFNNDFNDDYGKTESDFPGVAMLDLADYPYVVSVTMDGFTWVVDWQNCYRYALYYINAYGGWDTLLCRANGVEADTWIRHSYKINYDNSREQSRGTVDYLNEQAKRWTLRTGWLDDIGASRMHNLLGSVLVYLHDMQEDRILPVGITTTDAPYKTYNNEGAKLVSYEFEVALQQEMVRR